MPHANFKIIYLEKSLDMQPENFLLFLSFLLLLPLFLGIGWSLCTELSLFVPVCLTLISSGSVTMGYRVIIIGEKSFI